MSRPDSGLMVELLEAMDRTDELTKERLEFIAGYRTQLAERTKKITDANKRIHEIREEMKGPGQSDRPLLAAIAAAAGNGQSSTRIMADHLNAAAARAGEPEETADERQRGPTQPISDGHQATKRHWAVHKFDAKSKGKRGKRLGTVYADDESQALKAAQQIPAFTSQSDTGGRLVIGDEITPGSALTPPAGKPRQPAVERADRRETPAAAEASGKPLLTWPVHLRAGNERDQLGKELGAVEAVNKAQAYSLAQAKWPNIAASEFIVDVPTQRNRREVVISPSGPNRQPHFADGNEPLRTYLVSMVKDKHHSEVMGRVVAVDPGRAVRKAKDRWGTREEYSVRELTEAELREDLKVRPREPFVPFEYEKIDPMAAADRRIAAKLLGPPPAEQTPSGGPVSKRVIPPEDTISDQYAASYLERQSPGRPMPSIGPYNQDDALLRACALIARELDPLRDGATDDQIFQALIQWPTHRVSGNKSGNPWATVGGSRPRFYYDTDALDKWGKSYTAGATLEGDSLVKAVRRVYRIKRPRSSKADQQPVRPAAVKP